jgi:urease accessory protein
MTMKAEPAVEQLANPGLYRLLAWLSPSFPTGAFSYSHGLEATVASGAVRDRASLECWIAAVVAHGSGRMDADILRGAYRAAQAGDFAALDAANRRGIAFRATAELALEAGQQGEAFLATCRAAWPEPFVEDWASRASDDIKHPSPPIGGEGEERSAFAAEGACHSAVVGVVAACAGIALADALIGYLQNFAANLVSAGLRLGIIGQTDGQRILAALEPVVGGAATAALTRDAADFGAATFAADLASMAHESQYMRLFRS